MKNEQQITPQRLAVKLKPTAEKLVKQGHPWVFESSISKINKEGASGDLAILFDSRKDKVYAIGLYDPDSPIRIKVITSTPAQINKGFFENKIKRAYKVRLPLFETTTNSYRLIYGENDGFPGLIADVYNEVIVVKLYSRIWIPYLNDIYELLCLYSKCKTLVLRLSRNVAQLETILKDGQIVIGKLDNETVHFQEHGIRFSANVIYGHKTGYFLDHRENRRRVGHMSKDKTVLDVFSYAGGFSVHALVEGAREVTSLDISAPALEVAKYNASLNKFPGTHITLVSDAFIGMQNLITENKKYDIVIIDPPSFAKSAKEVETAKNSYKRLAILGSQLVSKGGHLVLASCSSRVSAQTFFDISEASIKLSKRSFRLIDKTYHDIDHPITFPEGAYLKCGYYQLE